MAIPLLASLSWWEAHGSGHRWYVPFLAKTMLLAQRGKEPVPLLQLLRSLGKGRAEELVTQTQTLFEGQELRRAAELSQLPSCTRDPGRNYSEFLGFRTE